MQTAAPRPGKGSDAYCTYRLSPALPCGLLAAALAFTKQIVASVAIGCCGCCCGACPTPKSMVERVVAVLLFIFSWYVGDQNETQLEFY